MKNKEVGIFCFSPPEQSLKYKMTSLKVIVMTSSNVLLFPSRAFEIVSHPKFRGHCLQTEQLHSTKRGGIHPSTRPYHIPNSTACLGLNTILC